MAKDGRRGRDPAAAYRTLARKHHPDVNPGDKKSEERFKDIADGVRDPVRPDEAPRTTSSESSSSPPASIRRRRANTRSGRIARRRSVDTFDEARSGVRLRRDVRSRPYAGPQPRRRSPRERCRWSCGRRDREAPRSRSSSWIRARCAHAHPTRAPIPAARDPAFAGQRGSPGARGGPPGDLVNRDGGVKPHLGRSAPARASILLLDLPESTLDEACNGGSVEGPDLRRAGDAQDRSRLPRSAARSCLLTRQGHRAQGRDPLAISSSVLRWPTSDVSDRPDDQKHSAQWRPAFDARPATPRRVRAEVALRRAVLPTSTSSSSSTAITS